MKNADLKQSHCVPCEGGIPALDVETSRRRLAEVPGWRLEEGPSRIEKAYLFKDFKQAMAFVNRVAELAEREGHHPDFYIHYSRVTLTLWTHAVGGLSENDFILAARIDGEN